ncbi:MAG: ATP-binding cassette domain-containing protein [Patescibacteria group bacterium]|nr:ATP-binding cassette domain-containing protein [Patescibacteria group bacterium]
MIEIKNLCKNFGANKILDDLSFSVKKGEILGFLGPNGAGKSSTMKIITGFWTPTKGSVEIDGQDVLTHSMETRAKIGYLPENVPLYDDMRVYEYLKFVAEIRGIEKDAIKKRIKEVIGDCGLANVIRKPIDELSKGYRQRVGLAQAIMHEPDILILDEPTTGLDPNQIVEIRDLIKKIGKEKTVIFSTHILSEVSATCDHAIIINNGKIVSEGKPDELAKTVGGKESVYLKVKGQSKEAIEKALKEIEKIDSFELKDKEEGNIFGFSILVKDGADIREDLSKKIYQNNWSIYEIRRKKASLEDIFRELTK